MEPNRPLHTTFTQYLVTDVLLYNELLDLIAGETRVKSVKVTKQLLQC
jgi:hypothetical protein